MAGFEARAPMGRYSTQQPIGYESWRGSTTFGNNAGVDRATGAFDNAAVEASLAGPAPGTNSLSGFGLPADVVSDMISSGNEEINRSQDSALGAARARAAGSGFSVSGSLNNAEDTLLSDYAGKRAANARDTRIDAAKLALQDKMSQAGSGGGGSASASRSSGFSPAPQDTGLAEGITKGQQLSLMSSLLPRTVGGGYGALPTAPKKTEADAMGAAVSKAAYGR